MKTRHDFGFGLEAEYLLVEAATYRPLWYRDLSFERINAALEAIPDGDLPPLDGLELKQPHRKRMCYAVEGYHIPDRDLNVAGRFNGRVESNLVPRPHDGRRIDEDATSVPAPC